MRMKDRGWIVSVDSDTKRMKMWRRNVERLGIRCAIPVIADARALPFEQAGFVSLLLDAPCSSLGVVRRHPEIKWWRSEEELQDFATLQLQILDACAKYVKGNGALVYSVCSFEPEETSGCCDAFVKRHGDFIESDAAHCCSPPRCTDGFFVVRFQKSR